MSMIRNALLKVYEDQRELGKTSVTLLAEAIGVSPSYVFRLLSGERRLNEDSIDKICAALGVTLADLGRLAGDGTLGGEADAPELRKTIADLRHLYKSDQRAYRSVESNIKHWIAEKPTQEVSPSRPKAAGE